MPFNPEKRSTKDFATSWVSLIYSASKQGKTYLLRDCDFILNTLGEDGLASLAGFDIPVYDLTKFSTPDEILQFLATDPRVKDLEFGAIDSFGVLVNKLFLGQILGNRKTVTWGDWDVLRDKVDDFITELKKLKKDFVCTALEQLTKNDHSGMVTGVPDIGTRNYSNEIPAMFDIVIHLKSAVLNNKKTVTASLDTDGYFVAGVRTPHIGKFGSSLDVTNMSAKGIHKLLQGGKI